MSFTLRSSTALTVLPNPVFGNTRSINHGVNFGLSITGVVYTYKRKSAQLRKRQFEYRFEDVSYEKMVEVQEFFKAFGGDQIIVTTHNDDIYTAYFAEDNLIFSTDGKAVPVGSNTGCAESGSFTLRFIEV